ncbi:MAG: S8 family serine peptidase [Candidatus Thiodiazotropha lotti]|nr:S8 family serine peptidase [Candidatus Thiodiazotropha lotti]MCW4221639.1 S8 family serine peptidase [Candidatus Thiodiazotropha lotti]
MTDKPILRFPEPTLSSRRTGSPSFPPPPRGPGKTVQGRRFQNTFDRLTAALDTKAPEVVLRSDPSGIAPERALVFVTAGNVQNFARAARDIGLEVFAETELEDVDEFPEGFAPAGKAEALSRTLYATMPTLEVFERISTLWRAYQNDEAAPTGAAPWWTAFNRLLEIRPWGPEDRLTENARAIIEDRLPFDESEAVSLEIEIWPTASNEKRANWREQTEQRIQTLGGRVVDRSSIVESGFIYEAILASLPPQAVRKMLDDPADIEGLATLEGVHLILPQTIGQAAPGDIEGETLDHEPPHAFVADAPIRAALLDGTPVAGHGALDGGVVIEDVHDLVRLSSVDQRYHATAMASLILRGDLEADGNPLQDSRLVCVPLLVDGAGGAWTPENRLFVDLVHSSLLQLVTGEEPLAPDVFVVNFSIGVTDMRFAGRMSALARLMDWWAAKEGMLFVISAGNIGDPLYISGITATAFEDSSEAEQRQVVRDTMKASAFGRTLLAPAEAMNGITVGAISKDLVDQNPFEQAGVIALENVGDTVPQLTSALGLGLHRAIKPDFIEVGGRQEGRAFPSSDDTRLGPVEPSQRTGLVVAAPRGGARATQKSRGTSPATALTTRAILQAAEALTGPDGPYEGQELPRKTLALLCRALAVNAARWPDNARDLYAVELACLGSHHHARAKEEVCRYFGYGSLTAELMQHSPERGVTMVGFGTIRKDQAKVFKMPMPESISGERVPRLMQVTIAWFSPVNPSRAQYRLASLEAVSANAIDEDEDKRWGLNLKSDGPDSKMVKRGSVWSKRMIHDTQKVPDFDSDMEIPICVQCRDASGGALSPDDDIEFAVVVTLEVEADVKYDIHDEIDQKIRLRLYPGA